MSANPSTWEKVRLPVGIIAGLAVLIMLSNRPARTSDGIPVVVDDAAYVQTAQQALQLGSQIVPAYDRGDTISDADQRTMLKAGQLLDAANNWHPERAGYFLESGRAYLIAGQTEVADERLQQCIKNGARQGTDISTEGIAEAMFLLSICRGMENEWTSAYELANAANKGRPNVATYITQKASAALQLKHLDEAKTLLTQALAIDPSYKRAQQLKMLLSAK